MTSAMSNAELMSCQAGAALSATRYVITIGAVGGKYDSRTVAKVSGFSSA